MVEKFKFEKKTIHIKYEKPELKHNSDVLKRFYDFDVPFLFYDLDFDGNKELIVVLRGAGQRSSDIFKVYALRDGNLVDKQKQITDIEPYIEIDGLLTIDIQNKTINIHGSNGTCNNHDRVYKFNPSSNNTKKGKYILEGYSLRELEDSGPCTSYTYKVDRNKKLILASKKTLDSKHNPATKTSRTIKGYNLWLQVQ